MSDQPPMDQLKDSELLQLLNTRFQLGFKHRQLIEFCSLLDEVIRRGLPISVRQHVTVDLTLKTKIAGAHRKFTAKSNGYLRELFRIGGSVFPTDVKLELIAEARDRLNDLRHQLDRLTETREAWNSHESTRPAIGTLRRRR